MPNQVTSNRANVLIVDDEPFSRTVVAKRVRGLDADIVEAEDGVEAFLMLTKHEFDLAIIDLDMPKLNGYALMGCMRAHKRLRHLPIIVLTSKDDKRSMEAALSAGATSYLVKPLNWLAFGEHIRHILQLGRQSHDRPEAAA